VTGGFSRETQLYGITYLLTILWNLFLQASGTNHPSLFTQFFLTARPHWIHSSPQSLTQEGIYECEFRFQHTKPLVNCILMVITNNQLLIKLARPLRAVTPGQVNKYHILL
jgi:tRNA-specific 2-thiouridylase